MKIKPSSLSYINFPFKAYRDKLWYITVLYSLSLLLFTSTLYAITPKPLPTPSQSFLFDTIGKNALILPIASPLEPTTFISLWASDITYNSAALMGSVKKYDDTLVWFEYGTASGSYSNTTPKTTSRRADISGLLSDTTYYFRMGAHDDYNGTSYSNFESSFKTLTYTPSPPSTTTGSASNVSYNSVTLNGTVNANGLSTTAWFEYGTTSGSYSITLSTQSVSVSGDTAVSVDISGLSAGTTYYLQGCSSKQRWNNIRK